MSHSACTEEFQKIPVMDNECVRFFLCSGHISFHSFVLRSIYFPSRFRSLQHQPQVHRLWLFASTLIFGAIRNEEIRNRKSRQAARRLLPFSRRWKFHRRYCYTLLLLRFYYSDRRVFTFYKLYHPILSRLVIILNEENNNNLKAVALRWDRVRIHFVADKFITAYYAHVESPRFQIRC